MQERHGLPGCICCEADDAADSVERSGGAEGREPRWVDATHGFEPDGDLLVAGGGVAQFSLGEGDVAQGVAVEADGSGGTVGPVITPQPDGAGLCARHDADGHLDHSLVQVRAEVAAERRLDQGGESHAEPCGLGDLRGFLVALGDVECEADAADDAAGLAAQGLDVGVEVAASPGDLELRGSASERALMGGHGGFRVGTHGIELVKGHAEEVGFAVPEIEQGAAGPGRQAQTCIGRPGDGRELREQELLRCLGVDGEVW